MIIACCDSRVNVSSIMSSLPGECFIHRNIANIVPEYDSKMEDSGTPAAIEFAVKALEVSHIVILGHSNCGGVEYSYKTLLDKKNINNFEYINQWVSCLQDSYNNIPNDFSETEKITFFEQENIKKSIKNLREYDFIDKSINANKLNVIGLWYQINSGLIKFLNNNNSFIDLD